MGRVPSPFAIAVGIGAGIASALGFAALVAGTSLAMPLFLFSALPVVIASLGWGTGAGIVALLTDFAVIEGFGIPADQHPADVENDRFGFHYAFLFARVASRQTT